MDFETRSKLDVKKVGAFRYAEDASTEILCLAYRLPGKPVRIWHPWGNAAPPADLLDWVSAGNLVEAHNAEFEYAIWNYVAVRRFGWPRINPEQLRCSAAKAAALALPRSLEGLGEALELPVKKNLDGRRHMLKMSKPRKPTKNNPAVWHETFEDFEKLFDYCENDVLTEESAGEFLPPLSPKSERLWRLTLKINERGIFCDTELCKIALEFSKRYQDELTAELAALTGGLVQTVKQVGKLLAWLNLNGVAVANVQAQTISDALELPNVPPIARRVLEIRKALGQSSVTKYQAMLNMACADQRLRGTLLFWGASTGRFAGRGIQPQNYPRGKIKDVENIYAALEMRDYDFFKTLFPDVFTALSSALRGMLRAAPGKELIAGDFSAIEARVLLWLAGAESLLEIYRQFDLNPDDKDKEPYRLMSAEIYECPVSKVTREQRELGKRAVLGCGYGMGHEKFRDSCKQYAGLEISEELAKHAVSTYREQYYEVKNFWYDVERLAIQATLNPGKLFKLRKLQFLFKGKFLQIQLPSGRRLSYYSPRVRAEKTDWGIRDRLAFLSVDSKTKRWRREESYGGKLVENITQAVAADLMLDSLIRLEDSGYFPILTVHDEDVAEIPKGFGSVEEFTRLMSVTENWAAGIPIKVEAWRGTRYRK
jgi:DNA polymerase